MKNVDEERKEKASLALHNILTHLWGFGNHGNWDGETWIVFHNLLILLSMRNKLSYGDYALKVFCWTGGIIPILEEKQKQGTMVVSSSGQVLYDYTSMANWTFDVHPNDENEGVVRIVEAYRKNRNMHLKKIDDAFAYLLTETNLETNEVYCEPELQEFAKQVLDVTEESLLLSGHKIQNLQFEASKDITADDVEKHLFTYFQKKGFRTEPYAMNTGTVYNEHNKIVCNTSITVEYGHKHSIVLISLTN